MFSLSIEFLTGNAVMTATASREEAEWPPHPARVFMALVAAHYETRPLATDGADALASWIEERQALVWLEQQGSPALSCATDVVQHRRSVVKQYVPVNDATMPRNPATVKPADLRDALGVMPALRSRQERTFPSVSIGLDAPDRFVHLIWSEVELPSELSVPFAQLLAKVIRVGHSSSLVQVWLNDATSFQPEPTLIPQLAKSRSASAANLRTIGTGLLADLDQRFNAEEIDLFFDLAADIESTSGKAKDAAKKAFKEQFGEDWRASLAAPVRLRPVVGVSQTYTAVRNSSKSSPAQSVFDNELLILTKDEGCVLGIESTNLVIEALRGFLLTGSESAPEWFTGHRAPGEPATRPHLALIPLSYVSAEHADGHLLGLALAFPRDISPEDRGEQLQRVLYDSGGNEREIVLKLGNLGEWTLTHEQRYRPPIALRSETWTGASTVWASVTPVVLDRHPKHDQSSDHGSEREAWRQEVAESVIESCMRIGLPAPICIDIDKTSWHRGAPRARPGPSGMPWLASKTGSAKQQVHVLLQFADEVRGPVLLGAGRYRGYGLCKPLGLPAK